jgi:hypothetical protein
MGTPLFSDEICPYPYMVVWLAILMDNNFRTIIGILGSWPVNIVSFLLIEIFEFAFFYLVDNTPNLVSFCGHYISHSTFS